MPKVLAGSCRTLSSPFDSQMAANPSRDEEAVRRPNREREKLVSRQASIVNRMKACLIRLGIRNFKPTLRHASERLETLRTPEGVPLPPNTVADMRRHTVRLRPRQGADQGDGGNSIGAFAGFLRRSARDDQIAGADHWRWKRKSGHARA